MLQVLIGLDQGRGFWRGEEESPFVCVLSGTRGGGSLHYDGYISPQNCKINIQQQILKQLQFKYDEQKVVSEFSKNH